MIYGYARCSTDDTKQHIDRQIRELTQLGVPKENIYCEYASGTKQDRAMLKKLLGLVVYGDAIVATEVSRITRSTQHLCELIELAKERQLKLIFGNYIVDCTKPLDPMTEGMLKMMAVFAELERNIISERVRSGMANAKANGKQIGRRKTTAENLPSIFYKHYSKYKEGIISKVELGRLCDVSYPTALKYIDLLNPESSKKVAAK